jgi:hypothetical protein
MTKRAAEVQNRGQSAPRKSPGEPKSKQAGIEVELTEHQLKEVSGGAVIVDYHSGGGGGAG